MRVIVILCVWWHCLIRILSKEEHLFCRFGSKRFCSCGFMNFGIKYEKMKKKTNVKKQSF